MLDIELFKFSYFALYKIWNFDFPRVINSEILLSSWLNDELSIFCLVKHIQFSIFCIQIYIELFKFPCSALFKISNFLPTTLTTLPTPMTLSTVTTQLH